MDITWTFSAGAFFIGLLILMIGGAIIALHQKIADNAMSGVVDYQKVKLAGLIVIGVGFIVMLNLHAVILGWLVNLIFRH